ncbi:androgen-dependent TFPI-regulating protein-like [Ischnura elegans]|uniref:androgen-dependent TFPI-regulating protein-like n=1 Tax=Ischnura elegans TaxID=197161 RepID=UPI001ED88713|nr:androgen-dependent TFPI-regulating protein-like [Ischnura elegans]XP_046405460.1 androgen-dependent TFPI-regulating protein-like [Ischnura elegans]
MAKSRNPVNKLEVVFHFAVFLHFVYGDLVILPVYSKLHEALGREVDDPEIHRYKVATPWFLTLWNSALHHAYFGCCCLAHLSQIFSLPVPPAILSVADVIRRNIFASVLIPSSIMTGVNYWVMYVISPEHVFTHFLAVYPWWINHSIHTYVVPFAVFELYLRASSGEATSMGRLREWAVLYGYITIYTLVTLVHHQLTDTWIYPFYDEISNWLRAGIFISLYASSTLYYWCAVTWAIKLEKKHGRERVRSFFGKKKAKHRN